MGRRDKRRRKKEQKMRAETKMEEARLNPKVKCHRCGKKFKQGDEHECVNG